MSLIIDQPFFYKAYKCSDYANDFIEKGVMHFGSLSYYGKIEDAKRQDETEGYSQVLVPGRRPDSDEDNQIEETGYTCVCTENGTTCYAFCVAASNVNLSYLKAKYGEYVVKICNPLQLLHDIERHCQMRLKTWPQNDIYGVSLVAVEYTKGHVYDKHVSDLALMNLSVSQKPRCYAGDKECRYILDSFIVNNDKDYVMLQLNKKLDYCILI